MQDCRRVWGGFMEERAEVQTVQEVHTPATIVDKRTPTFTGVGQRKSLDDLTKVHNSMVAVPTLASRRTTGTSRHSTETATALPLLGWLILSFVGILDA